MAITDRRGVSVDATDTPIAGSPNPGLAIKAPCRAATTANITLAGLQTIDGIALAAGNRVLVKNQTTQTQNGIYNASSGNWTRAIDAASNDQWANGTVVYVALGTANADKSYVLTTLDPVTIGTSNLTFLFLASSGLPANRAVNTAAPLAGGGTLTADLNLSLSYGGTFALAGGALQTGAGTGDVTWSQNAFVTTIAANAVTYPKFQAIEGLSLVGNAGSANDNVHSISGAADQIPIVNHGGGALAFTTISGDITNVTGVFTITANVVGNTKLAQMATKTLKGNSTGGTANAADLTVAQAQALLAQGVVTVSAVGISLNALGDTVIAIPALSGLHYVVWQVMIRNSGSVASLAAAQYGIHTAAAAGGVALVADATALSGITSNTDNALANMLVVAPNQTVSLTQSTVPNIYFRVTQVQSAGAAVDVVLLLRPLP